MIPKSTALAIAQVHLNLGCIQRQDNNLDSARTSFLTALAFINADCQPPVDDDDPVRRQIESELLLLEARRDLKLGQAALRSAQPTAARVHLYNALNNAAAAVPDIATGVMRYILRELGMSYAATDDYQTAQHFLRQARVAALDLDEEHPFCIQLSEDLRDCELQLFLADICREFDQEPQDKRVAAEKELLWTVHETLTEPTEEDAERSEKELRAALDQTIAILGEDHPLVNVARGNVALAIMAQRDPTRLDEAMTLLLKSQAMFARLYPARQDNAAMIERNIHLCQHLMLERGY